MTTFRFQEVSARAERVGMCGVCGKRVVRRQTFTNTVNPFNRNDDGMVCTPAQVGEQVRALADAWEPDFTHAKCQGGAK